MILWSIETRKHLPFFASVIGAVVAMSIAAVIWPDIEMLDVLRSMCGLLCWTGAVVYVAANIVRFITLGGDLLLHISVLDRWRLLGMKAAVLGAFMLCLHVAAVVGQAHAITEAAKGETAEVFEYLAVAKVVAIATFIITVSMVATLVKATRGRGAAVAAFGLLALAIIALQVIVLWRLGAPDTTSWFIGIGGDMYTVNLYANILPIILSGPELGMLPELAWASIAFNGAFSLVMVASWGLLARFRRFDFATM